MKRILSAGVALLYFASNVALANALESNLWTERRGTLSKGSAEVASLPRSPANISAVLDAHVTRKIARYFLMAGRIAAPSFVGLSGSSPAFRGVDDARLYAENVAAVKDANLLRPAATEKIAAALRTINDEKKTTLNPE